MSFIILMLRKMKNIAGFICLFITVVSFCLPPYSYSKEVSVYSIHLLTLKTVEEANVKVKEFRDRGYDAFFKEESSQK